MVSKNVDLFKYIVTANITYLLRYLFLTYYSLIVFINHNYYIIENFENAKKYYNLAQKIDPKTFDQYYELGEIYYNKSDHQKASKYFLKNLLKTPNHYDSNLKLGLIYLYPSSSSKIKKI